MRNYVLTNEAEAEAEAGPRQVRVDLMDLDLLLDTYRHDPETDTWSVGHTETVRISFGAGPGLPARSRAARGPMIARALNFIQELQAALSVLKEGFEELQTANDRVAVQPSGEQL